MFQYSTFLCLFSTLTASAAVFNVTKTIDDLTPCGAGNCSLRAAVIAANADTTATATAPHVIRLPRGHYVLAIPGIGEQFAQSGDLDLRNHIIIRGESAVTTIIDGGYGSAGSPGIDEQVLHIPQTPPNQFPRLDVTVRIEFVTITGGSTGGMVNGGSDVTFVNSVVTGIPGGVAALLGQANAKYNLIETAVRDNGVAGVQNSGGAIELHRSTISGNRGPGITSTALTSGVVQRAGALISNSTVSSNQGAGLVLSNGGAATNIVADSTFALNAGADVASADGTNLSIKNAILASAASCFRNSGGFTSLGFNLFANVPLNPQDFKPCITAIASDKTSVTATQLALGPLAANGGLTRTHALGSGSIAIDTGTCLDALGATLRADQRGVSRPQGPACDIGYYERDTKRIIRDLITHFDDEIRAGLLKGVGEGAKAQFSANLYRGILTLADSRLQNGATGQACQLLEGALLVSDGRPQPVDLITNGSDPGARAEQYQMTVAARGALGCR